MTFPEWEAAFPDESACCAYLVGHRWPTGVRCPRCGSDKIGELKTMPWHWQCYACGSPSSYRFSHISGTIFENTNKPLRDWFRVIHAMLTSKKGVSALQIYRTMGFGSYKTAWYMCHRVRVGLQDQEFRKLMGIVEVDETYIGGKDQEQALARTGTVSVDRKGQKSGDRCCQPQGQYRRPRDRDEPMRPLCRTSSAKPSRPKSVCWRRTTIMPIVGLPLQVPAFLCEARLGQYVTGAVHTNTIEGFWSMIKRGVVGTYHKVSAKYLPLYVAEFQFRYNNRMNEDIFGEAIRGCYDLLPIMPSIIGRVCSGYAPDWGGLQTRPA